MGLYYFDAERLVEFGINPDELRVCSLDAPSVMPAGSTGQFELQEDCLDENGDYTGYFHVIGYEPIGQLVERADRYWW